MKKLIPIFITMAFAMISASAFGQAIQRNAITLTPPNTPFTGTTWSNTAFAGSNVFSGVVTATNNTNNIHGTFTGSLTGSATSITGVLASSNLPPSVVTTNLTSRPATLWVDSTGTTGVRGQQYMPYNTVLDIGGFGATAMQPGDLVNISGTQYLTNAVAFLSGTINGIVGNRIVLTNASALTTVFLLTNNQTFYGLNIVESIGTNAEAIFAAGTTSATNLLFYNCNITGGRAFYNHATPTVDWTIDHCNLNGKSPITTEVGAANHTVVKNGTITVTNDASGLSQPFSRAIFLARNPGLIEVFNEDIYASDAGITNPVYCFASDLGSSLNYSARNISPNSLQIHNTRCHVSFTNPASAVFLITTNNAYMLDNVTMVDGSPLTAYNPSNYPTPFNYATQNGSGLTDTTITYNPTTTNYTYTFLGRAGDHVIITNKPNLFLTLAGAVDGDVAFAIEATNNIYIDYGGSSVEWLTPSNNPTASQGHGTLGISKFGSLVKVAFVEGAASTTNFLSAIQTYSTNVTLVNATSLVVQLNPGFADVNYVVTAPNDLIGATVTARTPTNFTLGFTTATLTSQVIEGGVIHR